MCGQIDVSFTNYLQGLAATVYWSEGDYVWNNRSSAFPKVFEEDYNGGQVAVTITLVTPEMGYVIGSGDDALQFTANTTLNPRGIAGYQYIIDTDCQEPEPVNYCDYSQLTGPGSVGDWLASAPEGANTDCIDVGTVVQQCGFIQIPITERVEPFNYWIEYVDENGEEQVLPAEGLSFEEDFNGGSVTYTFYIGGPEQDWVDFANEGSWQYPGQAITIDTDCMDPEPVNYCDFTNYVGSRDGSVETWLRKGMAEGQNVDCIDVGPANLVCGSLDVGFTNNVTPNESWPGDGFHLAWAYGTEIPTDEADWNYNWPIVPPVNTGVHDVIVFIVGPEKDVVLADFIGESDAAYAFWTGGNYQGGVVYQIDSDCIDQIPDPGLPDPPAVAECQIGMAGYTKMVRDEGIPDDGGRVKIGSGGEVNADGWGQGTGADGWGQTMRLYGATDQATSNVTATFEIQGGGTFGDAYNTLVTPGAGALQFNGYDQAATGITVTIVSPTTVTVTIDHMPANSSWSFNMPVKHDEGQNAIYLWSWMTGDIDGCVAPMNPTVEASVCVNYVPTDPKLIAPEDTEAITYGEPQVVETTETGITFSLTATANDGYTFQGAVLPEGWTLVDGSFTEAIYTTTVDFAVCEIPVTPTATPTETPPTETPTVPPTEIPTVPPTETPTVPPTETPTVPPTETPSVTPTETPTTAPTEKPAETPKATDPADPVKKLPSTGAGSVANTGLITMAAIGAAGALLAAVGVRRNHS